MTKIDIGLGAVDPNSFSNPNEAIIRQLKIFWDVDFTKKVLVGRVHLTVERIGETNVEYVVLDTRDITVHRVTPVGKDTLLQYEQGVPVGTFGSYLKINLPKNSQGSSHNNVFEINIEYTTSSSASALQWLTPEQTAGKKEPYMFSQCQAIHCRSIIPCQDTPYVKCSYQAEVTAPTPVTVLMSAISEGEPTVLGEKRLFRFTQDIPIASYLIAIACGRLQGERLGPRSTLWTEPELIKESLYEFQETEDMLQAAEAICGPYEWRKYDLLVLPPSFPFGGMENPCLTFVTPTLLAGDRSLAGVVAHEISHSWSGNLVTNSTFEHFWLNEGLTTFLERKIQGSLMGDQHRHFYALNGLNLLRDSVVNTLGETSPLTRLVPDLEGVDPDDAFSVVPYEKGHTFLFYLEQLLGGPGKFEPFIKNYFATFKFKSLKTHDFKNYLCEYFKEQEQALKEIDWETWLYKPGMPPVIPNYDKTLLEACLALADKWVTGEGEIGRADVDSLSPAQVILFYGTLLETQQLSIEKVKRMHKVYELDKTRNNEIRFRWLRICIKARWSDCIPKALQFVNEQGRMKYVRPIYRDLYNWEDARERTISNYHENKNSMMFVLAHQLQNDLHLNM